MGNGGNENKNNFATRDIELRIKRYQLWTAIAVFAAALIPTVTTFAKVNEVLKDISRLERKPLEGEWEYLSTYEKYYEEPDPQMLRGGGKALIIWKEFDKRYEVNISYGIIRAEQTDKPLLASFLQGYLEADLNGWPEPKNFTMDRFKIVNRVHYNGEKPILPFAYDFKDCNYFKKSINDQRVQTIECIFQTTKSKSYVTLKFNKPLH